MKTSGYVFDDDDDLDEDEDDFDDDDEDDDENGDDEEVETWQVAGRPSTPKFQYFLDFGVRTA
jgi:hypothetical protein